MNVLTRLVLVAAAMCLFAENSIAQGPPPPTFAISGVKYKTSQNGEYIFKGCNEMGIADIPKAAKDFEIIVVGSFTPSNASYSGNLKVSEDGGTYNSSAAPVNDTNAGDWKRTITAGDLTEGKTYSLWTKTGSNDDKMTVNGQLVSVTPKKLVINNN